jgi:2,5-dihydroxypyridine 5,6-dioxygenase
MKKIEMIIGAKKIVDECTKVKQGENVLIITDTGEPFSIIIIMSPHQIEGNDPPPTVAEAMLKAHVIFLALSRSIFHSHSRVRATKLGARCFAFSEFTEEDMCRGAIEADFLKMKGLGEKLGNVLRKAKEARITTPAGTDLYLDFKGRPEKILILNGICHQPGDAVAIILETAISPKVGSAQGVVVFASTTFFKPGLIREPIRAVVKDGMVTDISGGAEATKLSEELAALCDPKLYNVAELGIGFNPKAKMTGIQTQDKGVYGTCHIGFGSNISWGGEIKAATHYDFIMYTPKIVLDGTTILENYQFNL